MVNLLLANWFEALAPLLVFAFWILRAFMEAKGKSEPEYEVPEELVEIDQAEANEPAEARFGAEPEMALDRGGPDPMRSEVDDFLRRLEQQAGVVRPEQAAQRPPNRAELIEQRRAEARQRREEKQRRAAERRARRAGSVSESETVSEHVQQHVGRLKESQLAENASHMGEKLAQTDERMEARLQKKFDHKLGKLAARSNERRDKAAQAADDARAADNAAAKSIADMLANPEGVRNAVLLNEILTRPADRW